MMTTRPPSGARRVVRAIRPLFQLRPLRAVYVTGVRHAAARRIRRSLRPEHLALRPAIDAIQQRWGSAVGGSPAENPIFILGAGWRCGSTWLQRLVMSSGKALIWGEPLDRSCIVQTMSNQLLPFGQGWPPDKWFMGDKDPVALADQWVANLCPPVPRVIESHRTLFRSLFDAPARERGILHWGLKEVRLTTAHAGYLRLLFPGARFVFLIRNPFDAYRSYSSAWSPWFERWPDRLTVTARQFGQLWTRLAEDFLDNHAAVEGLLVRYEDLVSDSGTIKKVADYLELALAPDAAARPIRGVPRQREAVSYLERWLLRDQVRGPGRRLGYL
jgi:hypothetical protein